jgi:hypothetical protein
LIRRLTDLKHFFFSSFFYAEKIFSCQLTTFFGAAVVVHFYENI